MKNQTAISALLGITQHEMATLLGISRSQWSMYELGRGSLPKAATVLLSELLDYAKASEVAGRNTDPDASKLMQAPLEQLLRDNEYQRALTAKKITAAANKDATQKRALPLLQLLSSQPSQPKAAKMLLSLLRAKTSSQAAAKAEAELFRLQVKQQLLDLEEKLVRERLEGVKS